MLKKPFFVFSGAVAVSIVVSLALSVFADDSVNGATVFLPPSPTVRPEPIVNPPPPPISSGDQVLPTTQVKPTVTGQALPTLPQARFPTGSRGEIRPEMMSGGLGQPLIPTVNREMAKPENYYGESGDDSQGGRQDGGGMKQNNDDDQRLKMEQQRSQMELKQMQKEVVRMENQINRTERRLNTLSRYVTVSDAAKSDIGQLRDLVSKIKTATDPSEIDMGDFGDLMQSLNDELQKAEIAAQFPKVLKQANSQLKNLNSTFTRVGKKAASSKVDVSSLLANLKSEIDALANTKTRAEELFKGGQVEEAVNALRDDFFTGVQEALDNARIAETVTNIGQMISGVNSEIKGFQLAVKKLKTSGKDTSSLESLLSNGRTKVNEIKTLINNSPIDTEALASKLEDLQSIKVDFQSEYDSVTGAEIEPNVPNVPGLDSFKPIETPPSLKSHINQSGENSPSGDSKNSSQNGQMPPVLKPELPTEQSLRDRFLNESLMGSAWEAYSDAVDALKLKFGW